MDAELLEKMKRVHEGLLNVEDEMEAIGDRFDLEDDDVRRPFSFLSMTVEEWGGLCEMYKSGEVVEKEKGDATTESQ